MPLQVQETSYYCVQSWMVNKLKLTGNNLVIYAIIHGFSMEENSWFSGSIQYLCAWTNSTKQGVYKNLKYLCENGFLLKKSETINGVIFNSYKTAIPENSDKDTPVKNNEKEHTIAEVGGGKQSLQGVNKVYYPSKQSLPSNIVNNIVNIPSTLSKDSIEGIAHPEGGDATHTPQIQSKNNQICYPSGETKKESNGGCFRGKRSLISNPPTPLSEEDLVGKVTNTKTRKKQVQDVMQEQVKKPRVPDKVKMEKYLGCVRTKVFETFNIQDQKKLDPILDWFESIWEKGVRKIDSANFRHCMDDLDKYMKKYSWEKFSDILETAIVCGLRRLDWVFDKKRQAQDKVSEAKYFDKRKDETMEEYSDRRLRERKEARENFNNIYNTEDVR